MPAVRREWQPWWRAGAGLRRLAGKSIRAACVGICSISFSSVGQVGGGAPVEAASIHLPSGVPWILVILVARQRAERAHLCIREVMVNLCRGTQVCRCSSQADMCEGRTSASAGLVHGIRGQRDVDESQGVASSPLIPPTNTTQGMISLRRPSHFYTTSSHHYPCHPASPLTATPSIPISLHYCVPTDPFTPPSCLSLPRSLAPSQACSSHALEGFNSGD